MHTHKAVQKFSQSQVICDHTKYPAGYLFLKANLTVRFAFLLCAPDSMTSERMQIYKDEPHLHQTG